MQIIDKNILKNTIKYAFITSIPVLLGYLAIGIAFGLMLISAGYHWILAPIMSILIYAGAGQYIAVGLFSANASLFEVVSVIFLVNSRHMVYGLSLIDKFQNTGYYKPYLIFSLTDETYALLTTVKEKPDIDKTKFYFFIALFNHIYWITGSIIGAIIGNILHFNTKGIEFALTALFIVLLIEQYKNCKNKIPFIIASFCGILSLIIIGPANMLIISIISSIIILLLMKGFFKNDEFN